MTTNKETQNTKSFPGIRTFKKPMSKKDMATFEKDYQKWIANRNTKPLVLLKPKKSFIKRLREYLRMPNG